MIRIAFLLSLNLFLFTTISGQTLLFDADPSQDTTFANFGPNRKNFVYNYFNLSWPILDSDSLQLNKSATTHLEVGFRYKRQLFSWMSWLHSLGYGVTTYNLLPANGKQFPNTVMTNDKERLITQEVHYEMSFRLNAPKKGSNMGIYFDFGGQAHWIHTKRYHTRNKMPDGTIERLSISRLPYLKSGYFSAMGRLGYDRIALMFRYRLTPVLKQPFGHLELPVYFLGFEINLY